ncbi:MAG: hypothetical protein LN546_05980 [Rickettsia endosymbiont of Ecitomorpha arachnoides]|nr:hypothetical protein [Rickettsia endosymbiont of Ecitomorpha arachnoides]
MLTQPPIQYSSVALIGCLSAAGGMGALAVASFVTSNGLSWRYAFLAGAFIAVIGTVARKALRETADFANAKKQLKKLLEQANIDRNKLKNNPIWQQKVNLKTFFCLILN